MCVQVPSVPTPSYISPFKSTYMAALHIAITQPADGSNLGSLQSTGYYKVFCLNMPSHLSHLNVFSMHGNISCTAFNNVPLVHCAYEWPNYGVRKSNPTFVDWK